MTVEERGERREAMIQAVESNPRGFGLADVVRRLLQQGFDAETLFEDLQQIRPLVSEEDEDQVLDVMDLLIGLCPPNERLGPYAWGDERNVFWRRHQAGIPYAGPGSHEG